MAGRKKTIDPDRREAQYWAEEWKIRRKRNRIIGIVAAIAGVVLLGFIINYASIIGSRTIYSSEEEMKTALQGRFEGEWYEDIYIEGDKVTLTYYEHSHYDREFAERYGYSESDDSVYEDVVEKWDYRRGVIKCRWMDEIKVDKQGRLIYYSSHFTWTDKPAPEPIDPSTLSGYQGDGAEEAAPEVPDLSEEEQAEQELQEDGRQETQDAAEDAGILPEGESDAV